MVFSVLPGVARDRTGLYTAVLNHQRTLGSQQEQVYRRVPVVIGIRKGNRRQQDSDTDKQRNKPE
jgi:hypothetical protein